MLEKQLFSLAGSQSGTLSAASLCCPLEGGAATTLCPPSRVTPFVCALCPPPSSRLSLFLSLALPLHQSSPNISQLFSLLFFGSPRSHKRKKKKRQILLHPLFPESSSPPPIGSPVTCECGMVVPMPGLFCRSVRWKAPAPPAPPIWHPGKCFGSGGARTGVDLCWYFSSNLRD